MMYVCINIHTPHTHIYIYYNLAAPLSAFAATVVVAMEVCALLPVPVTVYEESGTAR